MSDFVPSPTDDALLWLHAIELAAAPNRSPCASNRSPADGRGATSSSRRSRCFAGSANPLAAQPALRGPDRRPRRPAARGRPRDGHPDAAGASRPRRRPAGRPRSPAGAAPRADPTEPDLGPSVVDLSIGPDAILRSTTGRWPAATSWPAARSTDPAGRRSIEVLPAPRVPVEVEIVDRTTGERVPGRVRFTAADGRYLPPVGHRDEINPGVLRGHRRRPHPRDERLRLRSRAGSRSTCRSVASMSRSSAASTGAPIGPGSRSTRRPAGSSCPLDRAIDLHAGRWVTADTHVHFLAPSTALLQAAAEDVDLVNLLAAQWGDLYTNMTDLPWGSMADPSGPPAGRRRDREPPEHARPPGAARRPPADRAVRQRRSARGPDGRRARRPPRRLGRSLPGRRRPRRRGPLPAALRGDRGRHRGRQDRCDRDPGARRPASTTRRSSSGTAS